MNFGNVAVGLRQQDFASVWMWGLKERSESWITHSSLVCGATSGWAINLDGKVRKGGSGEQEHHELCFR